MSRPLIYLVKTGNNYFDYEYIHDNISLLELNKCKLLKNYHVLNNSDYEMLKNNGGTLIYRVNSPERFIWLVNINHQELDFFLGSPLSGKIKSMIESVKRDLTINKVL